MEDPAHEVKVFVDYAHTDDALYQVLSAMRPAVPDNAALHVLFGCGGDRDRSKRQRMARVAATLADRVMVTSDNPRTEDPESIIQDILTGIPESSLAQVDHEVERGRAIRRAVAIMQKTTPAATKSVMYQFLILRIFFPFVELPLAVVSRFL